MTWIRDEIMALLPEERLEYAIGLLEELRGEANTLQNDYMIRLGLCRSEAIILRILSEAAPRCVTSWAMIEALGSSGDEYVIRTQIKRLRRKGFKIKTVYATQSYYMHREDRP